MRGEALREPETRGFVSATQAFTPSLAPVTTWIDRQRYASASDSTLTRVRLRIASQFGPSVGVTLC
jgi:hypothetical protein